MWDTGDLRIFCWMQSNPIRSRIFLLRPRSTSHLTSFGREALEVAPKLLSMCIGVQSLRMTIAVRQIQPDQILSAAAALKLRQLNASSRVLRSLQLSIPAFGFPVPWDVKRVDIPSAEDDPFVWTLTHFAWSAEDWIT
ncbi:hypothetical protein C8R45DRAFT_1075729 [Mycena sanguinolenta]|nr:hypothetical protein C8R45DRAFT_1075729 [Mycena sanguinolenta]